jgi:hypothetical protein
MVVEVVELGLDASHGLRHRRQAGAQPSEQLAAGARRGGLGAVLRPLVDLTEPLHVGMLVQQVSQHGAAAPADVEGGDQLLEGSIAHVPGLYRARRGLPTMRP